MKAGSSALELLLRAVRTRGGSWLNAEEKRWGSGAGVRGMKQVPAAVSGHVF